MSDVPAGTIRWPRLRHLIRQVAADRIVPCSEPTADEAAKAIARIEKLETALRKIARTRARGTHTVSSLTATRALEEP